LTFDDGPSDWTEAILDCLGRHGVHCTFFVLGSAIEQHAYIAQRAVAEGHELGNHTYSHPDLTTLDLGAIREELDSARVAADAATRPPGTLVRPPYFRKNDDVIAAAARCGYETLVLADVAPPDFLEVTPEPIVHQVLQEIWGGSIVDLHDGRPRADSSSVRTRDATVAAVAMLVPALIDRGYELVTVSALLARD